MKKFLALGLCLAAQAYAITGGPTMPEYTQFEEVSASNLVDPNSGNFTYTIPLMEVPGPEGTYPLALSYHSGIRYNQEASWVGLGWSLNAGAINRILRGVPDDYFNSAVATRNVANASGSTINVNLGLGNFGLAMAWDANSGQYMGATPYMTLGIPLISALGIGLNMTLSPGSVSVGVGASLPIGTVSLGLYDSKNNSTGSGLGFSPSIGGVTVSHTSGTQIRSGTGEGITEVNSYGVGIPLGHIGSLYVGVTDWRYSLDETLLDYMCGYLFQDGKGQGFVNRVPTATSYLDGASTAPRQRFERTKIGASQYPSSDIYTISANGMSGSFQPLLKPRSPIPAVLDGTGNNNDGYGIQNPASIYQLTFRMDGDKGYNLIHNPNAGDPNAYDPSQIQPDQYPGRLGNSTTLEQFGSYRITPVFETNTDGVHYNNLLIGFNITNADGITYQYLQPVYSIMQADYVFKDPVKSTNDRMEKVNAQKYASSWLLTAVKGADYLPVNNASQTPKTGDLGHWVKFSYSTPTLANWSAPYTGNMPPDARTNSGYYNRSYGIKQMMYLKTIETQTHRADFTTVDRVDVPVSTNTPVSNGEMTYDDGLVAYAYTNGASAISSHTLAAQGGLPINVISTSTSSGSAAYAPYKINFTLKFPGEWYKYILAKRGNVATGFVDNGEKLFGIHYKFNWVHYPCWVGSAGPFGSPLLGDGPCEQKTMYGNETFLTGTTTWSRDEGDFDFTSTCPNVRLNGNNETEVDCSVNIDRKPSNNSSMWNFQVYSAFFDWTKLEPSMNYAHPQALAGITLKEKSTNQITKEIRFNYDYSLCNKIPGHTGIKALTAPNDDVFDLTDTTHTTGKLTLKKVRIYGTGGRSAWVSAGSPAKDGIKLPDYAFQYQSTEADPSNPANKFNTNPNYGTVYQNDYWGMYSPTSGVGKHSVKQANSAAAGQPFNGGPKVGVCWNLKKITVPTGGTISVDYNRDEYYYSGLGKDLMTGKTIAMPNVFDVDIPVTTAPAYPSPGGIMSPASAIFDTSKYYQLVTRKEFQPGGVYTCDKFSYNNRNHTNLPTWETGPDNKYDFALTQKTGATPVEPKTGDMVMVAFVMKQRIGVAGTTNAGPLNRFVGVINIATVYRTDNSTQKRVKLLPLVWKDPNNSNNPDNNFFYYKNMIVDNPSFTGVEYSYSYYLIPIRGQGNQRSFSGGDVAVDSLITDNGFGKKIVKLYQYKALGRLDGSRQVVDKEVTSSGATWTLPGLSSFDKFEKNLQSAVGLSGPDQYNALHFDPWPYWCADDAGNNLYSICSTVTPPTKTTDNLLTQFLNNAFTTEKMSGGFYYPDAGISYSRSTETTWDAQNRNAGWTEYQFYNLSFPLLNEGSPYSLASNTLPDGSQSATTLTKPLEFNDWVVSSGKVEAPMLALNGKLMRKLELNSSAKVVSAQENHYNLVPNAGSTAATSGLNVYTGPSTSLTNAPLGTVQQKWGGFTMVMPNSSLLEEVKIQDNVTSKVAYPFFDSKSGEALVAAHYNSDGNGFATYKIPEYWGNPIAAADNQLTIAREERKYSFYSADGPFNRDWVGSIVSAVYNRWINLPWQKSAGSKSTAPFLFNSRSYTWVTQLYEDGAGSSYTGWGGSVDPAWRPNEASVSLLGPNSYPLERYDDLNSVYYSEFTGYGSNLVIGSLTKSRWTYASIYTGDYMTSTGTTIDGLSGWMRNSTTNVILTTESGAPHNGAKALKLLTGGTLSNVSIAIGPQKMVTLDCNLRVLTGTGIKLQIQPMNSAGAVGAAVVRTVGLTSAWGAFSVSIDLSQSQYAGATSLSISISAPSGSGTTGYVDDVRVYPSDALVKTYYYDPATYKLIAVVDENKTVKKFTYDTRGRLTSMKNNAGQTVSKTSYNDYQ